MLQAWAVPIAAALWISSSAIAQESKPTTGFVYNTKEVSSLHYECIGRTEGGIDCEFLQTSVRKKAQPEELPALLSKKREEFRSGQGRLEKEDCDYLEGVAAAVKSGIPTAGMNAEEFKRGIQSMPAKQKEEMLRSFDPLLVYCKNPTENNFLSVASAEHDKNTRTCLASSFKYKQRFRKLDKDNWSVVDSPSGPCGIVNVSRLERSKGATTVFWVYFSKKIITNPRGELLFGGSCSQLDEAEYKYDWRSAEHSMGCDYVNLSIL